MHFAINGYTVIDGYDINWDVIWLIVHHYLFSPPWVLFWGLGGFILILWWFVNRKKSPPDKTSSLKAAANVDNSVKYNFSEAKSISEKLKALKPEIRDNIIDSFNNANSSNMDKVIQDAKSDLDNPKYRA